MGSKRLLSLYFLISGYSKPFSARVKARLSNDLNLDPRPEYSRVILTWNGNDPVANVESTGNQVNSNFNALSFYMTKTVLVGPKWFWSDQIDLDLTIIIWSQVTTIIFAHDQNELVRSKL